MHKDFIRIAFKLSHDRLRLIGPGGVGVAGRLAAGRRPAPSRVNMGAIRSGLRGTLRRQGWRGRGGAGARGRTGVCAPARAPADSGGSLGETRVDGGREWRKSALLLLGPPVR